MTRYQLTDVAEADLLEIAIHIAEDSVPAAELVLADFAAAFERLVQFPNAGHERRDLVEADVRFWPVHSYLVIYRPETRPLQIIRVLSGYRNLAEMLKLK